MAISFVNAGAKGEAATGNITLGAPASPQANDIWVAVIHGSDQVTVTMTGDWTLAVQGNGGGTTSRLTVFWHRHSGGANPSLVVTHTGGQSPIGGVAAFRGCARSGSPFRTTGTTLGGTDVSMETTAITVAIASDTVLLCYGAADDNNVTLVTNYTSAWEDAGASTQNAYITTLGTPDGMVGCMYRLTAPTGSTGPVITQAAADAWTTVVLALREHIDIAATFAGAGVLTGQAYSGLNRIGRAGWPAVGEFALGQYSRKPPQAIVAHQVTATFAGAGNFSGNVLKSKTVAATFAGAGALSARANLGELVFASFAGAGALSANAQKFKDLTATFSGTGALSASLLQRMAAASTWQGAGSWSASARQGMAVQATFQGAGSLTAATLKSKTVEATFQGAGGMIAVANLGMRISATYNGVGFLSCEITIPGVVNTWLAEATFAGAGSLTAAVTLNEAVQANFAGAGSLTAASRHNQSVTAAFQGAGALNSRHRQVKDCCSSVPRCWRSHCRTPPEHGHGGHVPRRGRTHC